MRLKRTANFKEETATPEYSREKAGHFRQRSFGKSKMSFKKVSLQRAEGTNQPVPPASCLRGQGVSGDQ